jgi:hypothetical protein
VSDRLRYFGPVIVAVWLIALAVGWPISIAGDPQGVYFPVVQGLWAGDGIASFASLYYGAGRMPGVPLVVAIGAVFTEDLARAAQIFGVIAAMAMAYLVAELARLLKIPVFAAAGALVVTATSVVFVSSSLEALPDLGCALAVVIALRLLLAEEPRPFWIGFVAGIALLFRFNAIALVVIAPFCAAMIDPRRKRAALLALAGIAVAGLPIAVIGIGLKQYGISYPNIYIEAANISATEKVDSFVAIRAALRGLADTPRRLFDAFGVAAAGVALLVIAAREKRFRPPLLALLAMLALITPLHYEARYYLFLLAPAALAMFAFAARSKWVVAGLALWVAAFNIYATYTQTIDTRTVAKELAALCASIEPEQIAGIDPELYRYTHLKHCPTAQKTRAKARLSPAAPTDRGINVWIGKEAPPNAQPIAAGLTLRAYRLEPTKTSTTGRTLAEHAGWELDLPKRPGRACETKTFDAPARALTVVAHLEATPPLIAELSIGETRLRGADNVLHARISATEKITATLCAADPLRAKGKVRVRWLRFVED